MTYTYCMFTNDVVCDAFCQRKSKSVYFTQALIYSLSIERLCINRSCFLVATKQRTKVALIIALQLIQSLCFEGGAIGQERRGGNQATPFLQE